LKATVGTEFEACGKKLKLVESTLKGAGGRVFKVEVLTGEKSYFAALKILYQQNDLEDEALEKVFGCPNVVKFISSERIDGYALILMEWIDGKNLGEGSLNSRQQKQFDEALECIVYERQVKWNDYDNTGNNIMVIDSDNIKIVDFGTLY
jgi:serine/threonine protein kinase